MGFGAKKYFGNLQKETHFRKTRKCAWRNPTGNEGNSRDGGRELIRGLVDGNQRRGCDNFNLFQALGGFSSESATARRNVNGHCAQHHSVQEENTTSQVALTQMMNIINENPKYTWAERRWGDKNNFPRDTNSGAE